MKCPVDETVLQMTDRQGIEIDYCPQCRGVWLDRGELDKMIERSADVAPTPAPPPAPQQPQQTYQPPPTYPRRDYDDHRDKHRDTRRDSEYYRRKKKKDFLGDLFDF